MSHIPPDALALHTAILGMTGAGKTNTSKVAIEQVYAEGARVCILDPIKSDWWGITSSADGKQPGLPFHILGGPRGHVPLHSGAGAAIGELVARGKLRHSIIDMAQFEPGGQVRFFTDFVPVLLREMRGFTYLVMEEAHMFAPKEKGGVGNENLSTHWAKMVATAGRSKGIRLIVATQRTQALHNAVLGSCQTLIAHRLTAPADQKPVLDWLKAHIRDSDARAKVTDTLGSLSTGQGWIVSGEAGIADMRRFPLAATYDNTATPTDDDTEHDVTTAAIDASALRAVIGDAVRVAEENDVDRLKAKIKELQSGAPPAAGASPEELAAAEQRGYETGRHEGYGHGRADGYLTALEHVLDDLKARGERWAQGVGRAVSFSGVTIEAEKTDTPAPAPRAAVDRSPDPHRKPVDEMRNSHTSATERAPAPRETGGGALRRMMIAVAQTSGGISPRKLSILADVKQGGSTWRAAMAAMRKDALLDEANPDRLQLTAAGLRVLGPYEPLPTGKKLREHWRSKMGGAARLRLFDVILAAHPGGITHADAARAAGVEYGGSSWRAHMAHFRGLELVTEDDAGIRAAKELFG